MARKKLTKKEKAETRKAIARIEAENIRDFVPPQSEMPRLSNPNAYVIQLSVNDKNHISVGHTLEEALNNIKIEPTRGVLKIYTKGVIKVRKGDKEVERLLFIRQMSRLFGVASKLGKECAMAQTTRLFRALLEDNRTK